MTSASSTETPESALVDRLRNDEIDSLESEVNAGRRDHILKSLDERGSAQELIRQQYTGRYPFEMLQNANDAAGSGSGERGRVRFVVTDEALLTADEGTGFLEAQIRAICGLGRSSKDPRKSIGYKGLGFKSVGEITDNPQVLSDRLEFSFDPRRVRSIAGELAGPIEAEQRFPYYAFPFSLKESDLGNDGPAVERLRSEGFRTVFRLPYKSSVTKDTVAAQVAATIGPRLLLFLDATDQLELTGTEGDFSATAISARQDTHTEVLLDAGAATEHWLVFEKRLDVPQRELVDAMGGGWKEVEQVRVAVAVALDGDGRPTSAGSQPLHVYFPTEESAGLGVVLQADFALELDRRHIAVNPEAGPYNTWLAGELGRFLGQEVAPTLAARFPDRSLVLSALSPLAPATGIGLVVRAEAMAALCASCVVPTINGSLVAPSEALVLPVSSPGSRLLDYLDLSRLERLAIAEIQDDKVVRAFLGELGTPAISLADAVSRLRHPDTLDLQAFGSLLVDWSESVGARQFTSLLGSVVCVPTVSGAWLRPSDDVFFSRQREEIEFPDGLGVPIVAPLEVDGLREVFEAAGVKSFEWRQLLPTFVLPILEDPHASESSRSLALAALRIYFETEGGDPRLQALAGRVLLPARDDKSTDNGLESADKLYFSSEWLQRDALERLYGPFGRREFLAMDVPDNIEDRESTRLFLQWMGVADHPRVDERTTDAPDVFMVANISRHPHSAVDTVRWNRWVRMPEVRAAQQCPQGHIQSQQLRSSFVLDRFVELVSSGDASRLHIMWHEVARGWGTTYEPALEARFWCQHSQHVGERVRLAPSFLRFLLDDMDWVPCIRDGKSELTQPRRAWRLAREMPRRIALRVPSLPRELDSSGSRALQAAVAVVDGARPSPDDLGELLRMLEWEARDEGQIGRDVAEAARWATRTLDDVLGSGLALANSNVPLLASIDGESVFDRSPYIADDALLQEAWEPSHPILDGDRNLKHLERALQLRSLDRLCTTVPVPGADLPPETDAIQREYQEASPYLAAVACQAAPSRADDIFRRLSRLVIRACNDLVLAYRLGDDERQRTDAVSFIEECRDTSGARPRIFGVAHLEVTSARQPHWYQFGSDLARFLGVPLQADAFGLLLSSRPQARKAFLEARRIGMEMLVEARVRLDQPTEDESLDDLLEPVLRDSEDEEDDDEGEDGPWDARSEDESDGQTGQREEPVQNDEPAERAPLPEIDFEAVQLRDARPTEPIAPRKRRRADGHLGPVGRVDFESGDRFKREIGERGEMAAFTREQMRVSSVGFDRAVVKWVSQRTPFAPYDLESVDDDGETIYIDVKATVSDDPCDPFDISENELVWAAELRSRYFIYRVVRIQTNAPEIIRYRDPVGLARVELARLRVSGALLAFGRDTPIEH